MQTTHPIGKFNFAQHSVSYSFKYSRHSKERACQRAINADVLDLVLMYGTTIYRQGMSFLTILGKDMPRWLSYSLRQNRKI